MIKMKNWQWLLMVIISAPLPTMLLGISACDEAMDVDGDGWTTTDGDCDDLNSAVYPGAVELCDARDNDCDGTVDEGATTTFYRDADADGFGSSSEFEEACAAPEGYVELEGDCDDTDATRHPEAGETCDQVDNDCDGEIDEGSIVVWYLDADGDGYGTPATSAQACVQPADYVPESGDCADADTSIHPGVPELCDFQDNDCDGMVDDGAEITQVEAGDNFSLALCADGSVWVWGSNFSGQLGDGTLSARKTAVKLTTISEVAAISAGSGHSLAVKADGTVWAWGENSEGQLGTGDTTSSSRPVQVSGLSGIRSVSGGNRHSLAVGWDGTVYAWGYNEIGQLGDGTTTTRTRPVAISSSVLSGVTSLAAGAYHSLAVKSDGTVYGWGANSSGQVGTGSTTPSSITTPTRAVELFSIVGVGAGLYHSLAYRSDGALFTWGYGNSGQLGNGSVGGQSYPKPSLLSSVEGVVGVSRGAAAEHSIVITSEGEVYAFGRNDNGQLGDGTLSNRTTPVPVWSLSGTGSIAAGWRHSLSSLSDGVTRAFGDNYYSQLGDNTNTDRTTPVDVLGLP